MKKGKRYQISFSKVDTKKLYPLLDAVSLSKETSYAQFDSSIDIALRLNILQKHSVRGSLSLPFPVSTQEVKVLVFATGDFVRQATEAGADFVGSEELFDKIKGGWTDFDVAIAIPDLMKEVGKLGQILGRKGLMPNPKIGTVTEDISKTVSEFKKGKVEYRADKTGIVHFTVGRVSVDNGAIVENVKALYGEILRKKPMDIKGDYVKSIYLSSTMGPGIKMDIQTLR